MSQINSELELLEVSVINTNEVLEGVISDIELTDQDLLELVEEENRLRTLLRENAEKIHNLKARRATLRGDEKLAKDSKTIAEVKLKQHKDKLNKEDSKLDNFRVMSEHATAKGFKWVDYALPHQWQGALNLAHYGSALLNDTMGLGKTMQSIMYLDLVNCGNEELGARKVLVIAPNDMVTNYVNEFKQWSPHRNNLMPLTGATATGRGMAKMIAETAKDFVIVSNYEAIRNPDMRWLEDQEWDAILIDEAHTMKNIEAATFDSINALTSKNFLPITATFILNQPQDLFAPLHLILPEIFQEERDYLKTYCEQGYENKWTFKPGGEGALMRNLGGRIVKRSYEEAGIELPPMTKNEILIPMSDMSAEQYDVYEQITKYSEVAMANSEESAAIESVIALITRQRQAACYPAGITVRVTETMHKAYTMMGMACEPVGTVLFKVPDSVDSIKVKIAADRIEKVIKSGNRGVVFSQFKTALAGLEKELVSRGIRAVRFDGDTKRENRVAIKADFIRKIDKTDHLYDVVLCNYKTGGVGLTFTGATYLLKLDEEWNPGKNDQAEARIWRIGQTEPVLVETLRIDDKRFPNGNIEMGSIDLWMKDLNRIKGKMIGGFDDEVSTVNMSDSYKRFLKPQTEVAIERTQADIEQDAALVAEIDDDFLDFMLDI